MVTRTDYDELAAAGGIPKAKGKRKPEQGRTASGSTLRTYAPMKKVNASRRAERHEEDFGPQADACRELPCVRCGALPPSHPHHDPPRSCGGSDRDTTPLCAPCHTLRHGLGVTSFWREVGLDPEDVKAAVAEWVKAGKPQGQKPFGGLR